ncbi:efflux RND transporter periplasmic adaptor subunit [Sphingomonas paeninsulae]|jgi:RND family efflux transporter MFP subunit|uniref:Efflux RND transporter periplasmic adaptor subunit n=1 Tax=Sphingomonas paeninsulae TaxID=2319844 RepID=A0A494TMH4_SPHPE|nr:efflux RND transporter periplasmic adaptor subunit [Sphingomonas paeninsulae]AYJ86285.1 efflux RND transporter periplasmic adaptor subunit [Sphingomonas paeninsulae]
MNFESGFTHDTDARSYVAEDGVVARSRRRRNLIIGGVIALVVLLAAFFMFRSGKPVDADASAKQVPTVTVVVPGRSTVDAVVTATGNLAARREMPVGVAGEGGMVTQVLVEPGQWVNAGQVLATVDRRVQTQLGNSLAASITVAQADARIAQSNLDRAMQLVSRGFISKADVDSKTAIRDAARARVDVARAQLGQAQATTARLDIRSPAAGLVLTRSVEPGQVVGAASGVLFRVAKGGELELLARLGESDLARMRVGQQASVTPVGSTQSFSGQIWQVSPIIDPQTRQGIARVALPYNTALRPGGFAAARIIGGAADVPQLPESAVQSDTKGNYVYVIGADKKVARRDVKVGDVSDTGVTILGGLNGQEQVVLSAGGFLNPGETVIPTRATVPK